MSLVIVNPPKKATQIASDAVHHLLLSGALQGVFDNSAEELDLALPLQVFTLDLNAVIANQFHTARPTTWRYLLLHNDDAIGAVELGTGRGRATLKFSSFDAGHFVKETVRAVRFAETLDQVAKNRFVVRLLMIPSLYVVALWLYSKRRDIVIPIPPTNELLVPYEQYSSTKLLTVLKPGADARKKFKDSLLKKK